MHLSFTRENQKQQTQRYPRLMLEKEERARIALLEEAPRVFYVHNLDMPIVRGGKVVTTTATGSRGEYEKTETEFVGVHLCLGREDVMAEKGADPDACPTCQFAKTDPEMHRGPRRKFAQHVIRYRLVPGQFAIQNPFNVELLLWTYSDARFDELVDIVAEYGDIRQRDLMLGPCDSKKFQRYQIGVANKCEWGADEARMHQVGTLYRENKCADVEAEIARKLTREQIAADLEKVRGRWALVGVANGGGSAPLSTEDMASLFSQQSGPGFEAVPTSPPAWAAAAAQPQFSQPAPAQPAPAQPAPAVDLSSLFSPPAVPQLFTAPQQAAPAPAEAAPAPQFAQPAPVPAQPVPAPQEAAPAEQAPAQPAQQPGLSADLASILSELQG